MKTKIPYQIALALALLQGLPASLLAQTAASPATNPDADSPVVLETFTVNTDRDQGYMAVDSLAGGRMATPLRVTPSAVSAITKEFLNDLGLNDLQSALQWSLNVTPTNFRSGNEGGTGGGTHNFWSVSIRGDAHVQGGNPPTKNYFPTYMVIDTYNVDRFEINSGPNSILFGIGDIGGSLTTYTKTARFDRNFNDFEFQVTSFGGFRGSVDTNGVVGNFAIRVNALIAEDKGWRDGDYDDRMGIDVAATYKFNDSTRLRLEVDGWTQERNVYASTVADGLSLWNGTTDSPTWKAPIAGIGDNPVTKPGAPGVRTMDAWGGPANYLVYVAGGPGAAVNWAGGARSAGTGDFYNGAHLRPEPFVDGQSGATIPALPSREFAVSPPDAVLEPEALAITLSFEHEINENSEFLIQGYKYEDTAKATNFEGAGGGLGYGVAVDLNRQLPNGQPNPNYGKKYSDYFLDRQAQNHRVDEIRGQYSYHFDTTLFNIPLKQLFSVSAGFQTTDYDARQYQAFHKPTYDALPSKADNWTQAMVWGRVYWDNPQAAFNIPENGDIFYGGHTFNWYDFNSTQEISYAGIFSQSRFWDDRLNISLGARRDDYKNEKVGIRGTGNVPTISEDAGDTYSAGVVGYVTEWLGIVANVSSNFQPAAGGLAPAVTGEIFGPSFGKGMDLGLRVSTKDNKYYVSANYYKSESTDVIGGDQPGFQGIWDQYFKAGGLKTDIGPAGIVSGTPPNLKAAMNSADTYDVEYNGFELEIVANPTRNIRLVAHYSKPEGEKTNNAPHSRVYWAQHLPDWQAQANDPANPESVLLKQQLADAQKGLDATAVPTITANLPEYMYNFFGSYTFLDGTLDGLQFGAGISALGEQYANPWDTAYGERIKKPGYETYTAMVAYSFKWNALGRGINTRIQLNVDNLLDNDDLIFDSYQTYGTNGIQGGAYRFLTPRKFTLTANFSF